MQQLDPNESLGYHCNLTVRAFLGAWDGSLKGTGVSRAQLVALAQLMATAPLSQSELVARLSITAPTGVRLIDRMERDGLVVRQPDPQDGRVKLVIPTRHATEVWEKLSEAGLKVMDKAYQGIDPADIARVKQILQRVRENLKV